MKATRTRRKGTASGKNQKPELDRAPKEARLIPKGDHVAKRTLNANESEERNADLYKMDTTT